ncbi:PTS system mannose/fructose/N-acetylgalactosamine-transporter subunit IIB [Galactobacillus timonensis]|uniref:PTS system mannose/fructose/N-acetylgalactosamine-transporter subunit IIB n=1 Tax=Galactobacillus timonensis TaxID=2041840 RepID=UPI000C839CB2|nr:PTS sugar transporter subunit IIB [Galactobacillus timonensis]
MIKLLRIDERLIHGQVANQWARQLAVDAIVVANDEAAANELIRMSLHMAAPDGMKVAVKSVHGAIEQLNDPRAAGMQIFVVVNCPKDALEIAKNVKGIPYINVGNFGRVNKETMHRQRYADSLYANEEEVRQLRELIATGIDCEYRMLTTDKKTELADIIGK